MLLAQFAGPLKSDARQVRLGLADIEAALDAESAILVINADTPGAPSESGRAGCNAPDATGQALINQAAVNSRRVAL